MIKKVMSVACLFASLAASSSNANLIVNGSFEDGDYSGANFSWLTLAPGDTRLTGWEIGGNGVDWHNNAEFNPILFGNKAIDLNLNSASNTGSISQTFLTTVGTQYVFNFSMAAPSFFDGSDRLVNVNLAGVDYQFGAPESDNQALLWKNFSQNFTAVGANTTLTFYGAGTGAYWGPLLDNVSVDLLQSSVPEPASLGLMLLGLGLVGVSARRRKDA